MGSCFSRVGVITRTSSTSTIPSSPAKVISINGDLRQYPTPVLVSQVLAAEITTSSSSVSYFLCNSDSLYYDEEIPALSSEEQLRPNQIYFLLPASKRQQPLSASDMTSLALKATAALHDINNNNNNKSRVSPLISMFFGFGFTHKHHHPKAASDDDGGQIQYVHPHYYDSEMTIGLTGSISKKATTTTTRAYSNNINIGTGTMKRSRSVRKLQRFASRRAKLAVRSFRLRLTTIYEGAILS